MHMCVGLVSARQLSSYMTTATAITTVIGACVNAMAMLGKSRYLQAFQQQQITAAHHTG